MSLALVHHTNTHPPDALRLEELPTPTPQAGEALVEVLAAPLHPADLNILEGKYGKQPTLPSFPGNEGAGRIVALGEGVQTPAVGTLVALAPGSGSWRQHLCVPAASLVCLPDSLSPELAAQLSINPATAWRMLHDFVSLQPGDWVVQNASNSAVGRCLIQIAKARGWKTLNFVRRPELVEELLQAGGDRVIVESETASDEAKAALGKSRPKLGINAVGGESALRVANLVAPAGQVITYGAMARQPLKVPNALLIFKNIAFRGFWLTAWRQSASAADVAAMMQELIGMAQKGQFDLPVAARYPLAQFREAVEAALSSGRSGKILWTPALT